MGRNSRINSKTKIDARDQRKIHIGNKTYPLGGVAGAALVAVVILLVLLLGGMKLFSDSTDSEKETLTAHSTCQDFMVSPPEQRDQAVRRIAVELKQRLGRFDRLNVESTCRSTPQRNLGEAIKSSLPDA